MFGSAFGKCICLLFRKRNNWNFDQMPCFVFFISIRKQNGNKNLLTQTVKILLENVFAYCSAKKQLKFWSHVVFCRFAFYQKRENGNKNLLTQTVKMLLENAFVYYSVKEIIEILIKFRVLSFCFLSENRKIGNNNLLTQTVKILWEYTVCYFCYLKSMKIVTENMLLMFT